MLIPAKSRRPERALMVIPAKSRRPERALMVLPAKSRVPEGALMVLPAKSHSHNLPPRFTPDFMLNLVNAAHYTS